MSVALTPEAVEEVLRMMQKENRNLETQGLRLLVRGGGCSGLSYDMKFDEKKQSDHEFVYQNLKVFVDPKSFLYLKGTTLDYADSLKDKGFRFKNPNANKTCGCGESFSV
ncbi:MAG: heme biosynthesis protein HemY [Omnitrophica bacterium GWA2_52_8]|nr:MAG: heme biosynthesis protein HemY [Omnitrophica bacterium GWA2_52_8]